ncbi:MAG: putative 1,4-alpha-glucan branching enzyme [Candidatus Saccharibacteria bacterium]|nr:putative 1,4-alpha-glucan branching enzyme [Candidatus Saccharibacteria bacterium]
MAAGISIIEVMSRKTKKDVGALVRGSGVSFRVWAPFAHSVAVSGSFNDWAEHPLESENDGYWAVFVEGAEPGQEYKFVIKNGDNVYHRNDPRALHFTTTPGNAVIASSNFDWEDDAFTPIPLEEQVIYELHVGTFNRPDPAIIGTFQDMCDKLDHLAGLGVNMIEVMPIGSMLMDRGWGYAIDYIYAVESLYGGRHGFLQFVKAAHKRGIGIILDVVYNHFGPDENLDLWQFDGWQENGKGGIYFYNDWRAETPWGSTRPDFGREEVRQYLLDNVKMWLEDCRVDGLRFDSTIYIRNVKGYNNDPSNDLPEAWSLLQQANELSKKINPAALTIAEDVADNEYIVKPTSEGGAGFVSQWELGFPHSLREALHSNNPADINLSELMTQLTRRFIDNPFSRIIYIDSHDTAANGSARFNEVISPDAADNLFARRQSLIAAALLFTTPGIPMLFQGEEFMESGSFSDWQSLDWDKAVKHAGIVQAHADLIALRKNAGGVSAGLTGCDINIMHFDEDNKVIAYHRWKKGGPADDVVVIVNFGDKLHVEYLLGLPRNGNWRVRFNSTAKAYSPDFKEAGVAEVMVENGTASIVLPPASVLILSQDK